MTNSSRIFYDNTCRFCTEGIERIGPWLERRSIEPTAFENGAEESEMKLRWHDGREFGGAEALIFLGRLFWYTWPLATLARLPGLNRLAHAAYKAVAKRRHCFNGACEIDLAPKAPAKGKGWLFLGSLVLLAFLAGVFLPLAPWLWMWILAGALWCGFKGMALLEGGHWRTIHPLFLFWIGTDALPFRKGARVAKGKPLPLAPAFAFVLLGVFLLIVVLPRVENPIATGWVGVTCMLCLLHFGTFTLLAAAFRRLGFAVEPIMREPWRARSLGEFWGPRWNRAFSDWARNHVFRPLVRKFGTAWGTLAGFLFSGFAHELVISVPARTGYGLPTLYFLIEAGGLLLQKRFPLLRNRFVTLGFVLLPAPLLFHPPFVERVFAPMISLLIPN
ncbi:MAG: MBOAT family protein [Verrucomicrobiota bacterium]